MTTDNLIITIDGQEIACVSPVEIKEMATVIEIKDHTMVVQTDYGMFEGPIDEDMKAKIKIGDTLEITAKGQNPSPSNR